MNCKHEYVIDGDDAEHTAIYCIDCEEVMNGGEE